MAIAPPSDLERRGAFDDATAASGVVHDLGNLIQIAASALSLVSRRVRNDRALESTLARARTALSQAGALVGQALAPPRDAGVVLRSLADQVDVAARVSEIAP